MKKLKTIILKHKNKSGVIISSPYVTVSARLKYFRESGAYEGYQLVTEIRHPETFNIDESCLIKASVINPDGVVLSMWLIISYMDRGCHFLFK